MKISTVYSAKKTIKVKDMPLSSIGKYNEDLYIIHVADVGEKYLRIWVNSGEIEGTPTVAVDTFLNWDVELLPTGTKITLESNYE